MRRARRSPRRRRAATAACGPPEVPLLGPLAQPLERVGRRRRELLGIRRASRPRCAWTFALREPGAASLRCATPARVGGAARGRLRCRRFFEHRLASCIGCSLVGGEARRSCQGSASDSDQRLAAVHRAITVSFAAARLRGSRARHHSPCRWGASRCFRGAAWTRCPRSPGCATRGAVHGHDGVPVGHRTGVHAVSHGPVSRARSGRPGCAGSTERGKRRAGSTTPQLRRRGDARTSTRISILARRPCSSSRPSASAR